MVERVPLVPKKQIDEIYAQVKAKTLEKIEKIFLSEDQCSTVLNDCFKCSICLHVLRDPVECNEC